MIKRREILKEIVYDIPSLEFENDMELICDKLSEIYVVRVTNKIEGPGTTIWNITILARDFLLVNNSWGNFLKPENEEAKYFIEAEFDKFSQAL